MLEVIASNDLYSLWGAYILEKLVKKEVSIKFSQGINVEEIQEVADKENSYGVILLGKPIQENQVEAVEQALQGTVETPFTKAYHLANWGENLNVDLSIVDEELNFVTKLVENIETGDSFLEFKDVESARFAREIADGLQSHHKYDGGVSGKNLMLIAELYGENLLERDYLSLENMGDVEGIVLKSLQDNMKYYANKKIEEANIQVTDSGTIVVSLFAEKHVNEIGRAFIKSLTANGSEAVVLIGKQTKRDDIYHIRTSEGISAREVALKLNRGKGKERAATVFLPKGNTPIYNTIIRTLNSANI